MTVMGRAVRPVLVRWVMMRRHGFDFVRGFSMRCNAFSRALDRLFFGFFLGHVLVSTHHARTVKRCNRVFSVTLVTLEIGLFPDMLTILEIVLKVLDVWLFLGFSPPMSALKTLVVLPEGTCCHRAALYFLKKIYPHGAAVSLMAVNSFYEGMETCKKLDQGRSVGILIPDINEVNGVITWSQGFSCRKDLSFYLANPPLHFAVSAISTTPAHHGRCSSIPALRSALERNPDFQHPDGFKFHDVHTTQEAALAAAEGESQYCLTNEAGLKRAGKRLRSILKLKKVDIHWKIFHFSSKR